ncbi:MAG: [protein-PII] uridylyltransferase [Actinobacteria bacterium]|nr:[protein-PII] uridylyltransferase [Actinomycetota bacterium]
MRRAGLVGVELREELSHAYDQWLVRLFDEVAGDRGDLALVAVGGLGRREPAPYSDLDLVLLSSGRGGEVRAVADALWYPIWDGGIGLDHSVRTPDEALAVAKTDLKAMLGLLDMRHLAGDAGLSASVRDRVLASWRSSAPKRVDEFRDIAETRWAMAGEAAFLIEPNLKDSRGGLRDAQTLWALAIAQLVDLPLPVRAAKTALLDLRGNLQRLTQRNDDTLRQQEHGPLAERLGLGDGDEVLRIVNGAARTIALALDSAWRRVAAARPKPRGVLPRLLNPFGSSAPPARLGVAKDVVVQAGEIALARDADPWADPLLVLRAARAAAEQQLPLAPFTLDRLASESGPMPVPWPPAALDEFVTLLGTGAASVPVMESLDQAGLLHRLIPEWVAVRFRIQHNPVHRYTVDRHLFETAARAAELIRQVNRPELLLLGALLHDIGKGFPEDGDHSEVGAQVAEPIVSRMGLSDGDVATVTALVLHHLLLPDTATRRDLDDPMTVHTVAEAVSGSVDLLDLLHALTIADAQATGPAVWSDWKAGLVADLVRRTRSLLAGGRPSAVPPLDERRRRLAEAGALAVEVDGDEVLIAAPDGMGVLSRAAGVLALHSLDVRAAKIGTHAGMAVNSFVVEPRFGRLPEPEIVRRDLAQAIAGGLPLADRLEVKERAYARDAPTERRPPSVHWFDGVATDATVLELRADDAIGLLFRVTAALERLGVNIRAARVSSLGGAVVDAFYVTTADGRPVPEEQRAGIERTLVTI